MRPEARIGVNLGLTRDRTAIVASQVAPDGKLEVLHVEILQGTRTNPVSLIGVEQRTLHLAHTLGTTRIEVDRWMSAQMAEGLCRRGLWVTPVTCDAAWLDPAATNLKRWFAQRHIRIPAHPGLIEELEGLEAKELRRRDRVRFTATGARYQDNAWLRNRRFAGWAPQLIANALGVSLVTLGQVER